MTNDDATNVFKKKIKALYDIESELEKALPKLEKAATDPELKEGFRSHLEETKEHSRRLEKIFKMLDIEPDKLKCEGVRGIIEDADWVVKKSNADDVLTDAMIAGAARYAEHYEMAGYMGAILEAKALGMDDAAELLSDTLREEENADTTLAGAMRKGLEAQESR